MRRLMIGSICFALLFFAGCKKTLDPDGPVGPVTGDSRLNIKVDPRMELLAAIQHFTSWATLRHTKFDFQYKTDIDNYFKSFSGHAAVIHSGELSNNGFAYDAPPAFILYHSDPPDLQKTVPYSSYLIGRAGSEATLDTFADEIRDFAVKSNFMDFYTAHAALYAEIENDIRNTIGSTDYIGMLESFYGEKKHSYNIIPTPLFHTGGYATQIVSSSGMDVYDICGPMAVTLGKLNFGTQDYFSYILLHEFSHSFVNPITSEYSASIVASAPLYEPIRTRMTQMAYTDWQTCLNEHLVRVNVARMALRNGQASHDQIIQSELNQGFIYIMSLDTLMARYEQNRATYATYDSFYPEIIKHLNSLVH